MRIGEENVRRAAAELDPLPTGTADEILSSYQAFWDALVALSHADYVNQAADREAVDLNLKAAWRAADDDQRARIKAILAEQNSTLTTTEDDEN